MLSNYHTHTYLCGHAEGTPVDYAKEAIKKGLTILGISDHGPLPDFCRYDDRMDVKEYKYYLKLIEEAQAKYRGKITILKGIEIEYYPEYYHFLKKLRKKLDYMILACHDARIDNQYYSSFAYKEEKEIIAYAENLVNGMKTGLFDIIAHPDLFTFEYHNWDQACLTATKMILETAKQYDIVLEFNANGLRRGMIDTPQGKRYRYPRTEFWLEVAKTDIRVIVGSDAHQVHLLEDDYVKQARAKALELGLNVISRI